MSETPPIQNVSILRKKVAGVPVLYLVAGFVLILAVVAWRMKPNASASAPDSEDQPSESASDTILTGYPDLPLGTVSTPASGVNEDVNNKPNESIEDNDEWLRRGTMYLVEKHGVSGGQAQQALSLYLDGNDLTFQQGQWRDLVIRELGVPPFPVQIGSTKADIGRVQGSLPRDHIVKNVNEDSSDELAQLYYGRKDAFAVDAIKKANGGAMNYKVGSTVHVPILPTPSAPPKTNPPPVTSKPKPKPSPTPAKPKARTYTVKKGDSLSGIAKKYYGSFSKWTVIYNANRSKIKNPNLIYPGQVLVIP